jgi:hypothetical protein
VSERAVVFIAPQALEAFLAYGYDVGAVESAMGRALDICRKHRTFVCLDLLGALPKDAFFDITHLNRRGHEQLARVLVAEIERARLLP